MQVETGCCYPRDVLHGYLRTEVQKHIVYISFNTLSRYTDRSKTNEGTKAGVAGPSTIYYESRGIFTRIFQADVHAITWCVEVYIEVMTVVKHCDQSDCQ